MTQTVTEPTFLSLELAATVQQAVDGKGYVIPTPIQAKTIPFLLQGRDVLGQACTGTGKTAAFALPLLSRIDLTSRATQVLVLAPTRELAIQVAASFAEYGQHIRGLNVQPIYGGASYYNQIKELKRGAQIVVGTPGRVMDHMRRGTLNVSGLKCLVLDEADEMLRMGFVDDVRWVLEQIPAERQIALFSATMPEPIRRIANEYLRDPATITIRSETSTASTIRSRYLVTPFREKNGALIRILETETTDGVIVFVKTRETTLRVADALTEHGFSAIAINGDIAQRQREHTIEQLKNGKLDILVATDVAARGLDVQRISHVINYDIPHDSEAWVHRIGRTGRAGRQGEAILFLTPAERRHLRSIERDTRTTIAEMEFPSAAAVNARRKADFKQKIVQALQAPGAAVFQTLLTELQEETGKTAVELAAAVATLMFGDRPFLIEEPRRTERFSPSARPRDQRSGREFGGRDFGNRDFGNRDFDRSDRRRPERSTRDTRPQHAPPAPAPEPLAFEHRKPVAVHAAAAHSATVNSPPKAFAGPAVGPPSSGAAAAASSITGSPSSAPSIPRENGAYVAPNVTSAERNPATDSAGAPGRSERPAVRTRAQNGPPERRGSGNDRRPSRSSEAGMETFRVEVGHEHGVQPGNIVGAIANEAGLDSKNIGRIQIREDHSLVDLPEGMPRDIFRGLKEVVVLGRHLRISRMETPGPGFRRPEHRGSGAPGKRSRPGQSAGGAPQFPGAADGPPRRPSHARSSGPNKPGRARKG
jgi:ATP-dependent RNA helicase DeaD